MFNASFPVDCGLTVYRYFLISSFQMEVFPSPVVSLLIVSTLYSSHGKFYMWLSGRFPLEERLRQNGDIQLPVKWYVPKTHRIYKTALSLTWWWKDANFSLKWDYKIRWWQSAARWADILDLLKKNKALNGGFKGFCQSPRDKMLKTIASTISLLLDMI